MGARAANWPKDKLAGMAGFFAQLSYKATQEWKEEIVYFDPFRTNAQGVVAQAGVFPDGKAVQFSEDGDPRTLFADWLITPQNPWFARNIVNRIWYWLLGRGIVHEPDDIRPDNPPQNAELLAFTDEGRRALHGLLGHAHLQRAVTDVGALLQPRQDVSTLARRSQHRIAADRDIAQRQVRSALPGRATRSS
jgi:hypothetical protein